MYASLLDTEYLLDNTVIDKNVDVELLSMFIREAQDMNIQQVIGTTLYQKLMNDVFTTGAPIGNSYKILVDDYIIPCQCQWVVYHSLPYLNYKLTNISVSEKSSEHSNPTDLDTIKYLRDEQRNKAEFYSQRITEYICNNISSYPEYNNPNNTNEIRPKSNNYFGGIYLRK
ncbi:MAG: hypothetical protein EOO06_00395 [Chitinophagaceae bacterium]|nr:MAG: hypothetical protein EOO06_00395 [Chitinophagaceae bacterium]